MLFLAAVAGVVLCFFTSIGQASNWAAYLEHLKPQVAGYTLLGGGIYGQDGSVWATTGNIPTLNPEFKGSAPGTKPVAGYLEIGNHQTDSGETVRIFKKGEEVYGVLKKQQAVIIVLISGTPPQAAKSLSQISKIWPPGY